VGRCHAADRADCRYPEDHRHRWPGSSSRRPVYRCPRAGITRQQATKGRSNNGGQQWWTRNSGGAGGRRMTIWYRKGRRQLQAIRQQARRRVRDQRALGALILLLLRGSPRYFLLQGGTDRTDATAGTPHCRRRRRTTPTRRGNHETPQGAPGAGRPLSTRWRAPERRVGLLRSQQSAPTQRGGERASHGTVVYLWCPRVHRPTLQR